MTVRELNEEQFNELKWKVFYEWEVAYEDDEVFIAFCKSLSEEELQTMNNAQSGDDVPDSIVLRLYDGVYFVEEDFWCSKGDDEDEKESQCDRY